MRVQSQNTLLRLSVVALLSHFCWGIKKIQNGLAAPEVFQDPIVTPPPKCEISGPALDILFVLDSSGSLKEQFSYEINAIKNILDVVAVSEDTTRAALVQFSGNARTEFHFNTFKHKHNIMAALDSLRHMSGITKIGNALEHALGEFTFENGMRGPEVPKVLFILSDGRTHDWPKDWQMADEIRRRIPGIEMWAYGTGEYYAESALLNYTRDVNKIAREWSLEEDIQRIFADFAGRTICKPAPPCVPGSDKPMDLLFVLDASTSVGQRKFDEQTSFMLRLLQNININNNAIKVALISYTGHPKLEFDFNRFHDAEQVKDYIRRLTGRGGATSTRSAMLMAHEVLSDPTHGVRGPEIPKVVIALTDGHSQDRHQVESGRVLALPNIVVYAIAVSSPSKVDMPDLLILTGQKKQNVFHGQALFNFEKMFVEQYVGFGCAGYDGLQPADFIPYVRGAVNTECDVNGVDLFVRTRQNFFGWLYVKNYYGQPGCSYRGYGDSNEAVLNVFNNNCGVNRHFTIRNGKIGFEYNYTAVLQFHQDVVTRVDQALDISCFKEDSRAGEFNSLADASSKTKRPEDAECSYSIRKFSKDGCVALDAPVGEILHHRWQCDVPSQGHHTILVHDCYVESDELSLPFLDSDGCEVDPYMLETPEYDVFYGSNRRVPEGFLPKAHQEMSVFKFPQSSSVRFRCRISLCDVEANNECSIMIPPRCSNRPVFRGGIRRQKRQAFPVPTKRGFIATREVVTRRINVLENENLNPNPDKDNRYCLNYY
jgi:Mg-chelatase subunit ChlD